MKILNMEDLKYKKFVRLGHKFIWSEVTFFLGYRQDIYTCEKCNYKVLVYDNGLNYLSNLDPIQSVLLSCNECIIQSIIE